MEEYRPDDLCSRCDRRGFMGRLLKMGVGPRKWVCIDCFSFLSGVDPRDPVEERTARSGDPFYLTVDEWRQMGEPRVPVVDGAGMPEATDSPFEPFPPPAEGPS
ncbi:MAG: hypothetical protein ACRDPE_19740, partial [Solirubrobacterales bacterium]